MENTLNKLHELYCSGNSLSNTILGLMNYCENIIMICPKNEGHKELMKVVKEALNDFTLAFYSMDDMEFARVLTRLTYDKLYNYLGGNIMRCIKPDKGSIECYKTKDGIGGVRCISDGDDRIIWDALKLFIEKFPQDSSSKEYWVVSKVSFNCDVDRPSLNCDDRPNYLSIGLCDFRDTAIYKAVEYALIDLERHDECITEIDIKLLTNNLCSCFIRYGTDWYDCFGMCIEGGLYL